MFYIFHYFCDSVFVIWKRASSTTEHYVRMSTWAFSASNLQPVQRLIPSNQSKSGFEPTLMGGIWVDIKFFILKYG